MIEIPLKNSESVAFIDDEDYLLVCNHVWWRLSNGYAVTQGKLKPILMHRLLLGLDDTEIQGDHINGDRLDNRRANLRAVSHAQQMQNRKVHKNCKAKVRGVFWEPKKRLWVAQVKLNGRRVFRQRSKSFDVACLAVRKARQVYMTHAIER